MKRSLMDRLTNRDVVREQKINILHMVRDIKEKDELIMVQAEAIDEFREQVTKLSEEISGLWDSVNSKTRTRRKKEDESEKDEQ